MGTVPSLKKKGLLSEITKQNYNMLFTQTLHAV